MAGCGKRSLAAATSKGESWSRAAALPFCPGDPQSATYASKGAPRSRPPVDISVECGTRAPTARNGLNSDKLAAEIGQPLSQLLACLDEECGEQSATIACDKRT